jgi:hypothetical protein
MVNDLLAALQPDDSDPQASEKHESTISTSPPHQPIPGPMSLLLIDNLHEIDPDALLTKLL